MKRWIGKSGKALMEALFSQIGALRGGFGLSHCSSTRCPEIP